VALPEILRPICRAGAILCLAAILGAAILWAAAQRGLAETAGPPAGDARIWIYRTFDPSVTLQTPYVRINGAIVGVARLGDAFYRDVRPGNYLVTADSRGSAPDQFARLSLAAGQIVYVKVAADNWWTPLCRWCRVDTFYTLLIGPPLARAEMASLPVRKGS
jgi:hypothetical protein